MNKLWENKIYSLDCKEVFSVNLLKFYINKFWTDCLNIKEDNKHIIVLVKLLLEDDNYVSIGSLQRLNKNDKKDYLDYLNNIIESKKDFYNTINTKGFIFSYGFRKGIADNKIIKKIGNVNYQSYYKSKLPITFNPNEYGKVLLNNDNKFIIFIDNNSSAIITQYLDSTPKYNLVEYFRKNKLVYSWKDTLIDDLNNIFIRELGKTVYTIRNNVIISQEIKKSGKYTTKLTRKLNWQYSWHKLLQVEITELENFKSIIAYSDLNEYSYN